MTPVARPARPWVAVAALAAGVVCAVVILVPVAETHGVSAASWVRIAFKPGCHQITERCLDLGAGPLPICARCAGLYLGGFAGLLLTAAGGRRIRPGWRWIVATAVPSVVDFALGLLGLPNLPNWPRFAVVLVPGLLVGLLVADALCAIIDANSGESRQTPIT